MDVFKFLEEEGACQEGVELVRQMGIRDPERIWDELYRRGSRFLIWAFGHCQNISKRDKIRIARRILSSLNVRNKEDLESLKETDVTQEIVRSIFKGLDNPYRGM